jgi:hypothetical protein
MGIATWFSSTYSNSGELLTGFTAVSSNVSRTTSSPPVPTSTGVWYDSSDAGDAIRSGISSSSDSSRIAADDLARQWHRRSDMDSTRAPNIGRASSKEST